MGKDRNTYAKRQRETGKKQKAEAKRARRLKKKQDAKSPDVIVEAAPISDEQ